MGILRYAVLGAIGFVLLPTPPMDQAAEGTVQPVAVVETHDLLSAVFGTFSDLASFCARQPQTCEAMSSVAAVAESKARYSFKLAYEWANGTPGTATTQAAPTGIGQLLGEPASASDPDQAPAVGANETRLFKQSSAADPIVTGSVTQLASADEGTNTLRIDDIIPDWRGPEPVSAG
jgi:hypothetical protein